MASNCTWGGAHQSSFLQIGQPGRILGRDLGDVVTQASSLDEAGIACGSHHLFAEGEEESLGSIIQLVPAGGGLDRACDWTCFFVDRMGHDGTGCVIADPLAVNIAIDVASGVDLDAVATSQGAVLLGKLDPAVHQGNCFFECSHWFCV